VNEQSEALFKGEVRLLATLDAVECYGHTIGCTSAGQAICVLTSIFVAFNLEHPRRITATMEVLEAILGMRRYFTSVGVRQNVKDMIKCGVVCLADSVEAPPRILSKKQL
jgi:hypothetical protein